MCNELGGVTCGWELTRRRREMQMIDHTHGVARISVNAYPHAADRYVTPLTWRSRVKP